MPRRPEEHLPDGILAIQRELASREWSSVEEASRVAEQRIAEYNRTPQESLGGLSPNQVSQLLEDPWDGTGPMRLDETLPAGAWHDTHALLLTNAPRLLEIVAAEGPLRLTPAGNLPRAFVARVLGIFEWWPGYIRELERMNKVINEFDVAPLYETRELLQLTGLLRKAGRLLRITPAGRAMLEAPRGTLAAALFRAHWRDFAFPDDGPLPTHLLQEWFPLLLWKLSRLEVRWWGMEELAEALSVPELRQAFPQTEYPIFAWAMHHEVFTRLGDFGLIELDLDSYSLDTERYRPTPLLSRFVRWKI
jgi:hypothetical protein